MTSELEITYYFIPKINGRNQFNHGHCRWCDHVRDCILFGEMITKEPSQKQVTLAVLLTHQIVLCKYNAASRMKTADTQCDEVPCGN